MSYLQVDESPVGGISKGIFSFWVRAQAGGEDHEIPERWVPDDISLSMAGGQVAFSGSSYAIVYPQLSVAHIWAYPYPGPNGAPISWMDGLVPFITFGDANLPIDVVDWKIKKLNKIWLFGRGGVPQELVSQYPEPWEKKFGYLPPCCIGAQRNGTLRIILQTSQKAQFKGCAWAQSRSETIRIKTPLIGDIRMHCALCKGVPYAYEDWGNRYGGPPNQYTGYNFHYDDVSQLECAQCPEAFIIDSGVSVMDGRWHHVLFSFDLTGTGALEEGLSEEEIKEAKPQGIVKASAEGPEGKEPFPGTWGQYSGPQGEYALGGPANDGRPDENTGKYGFADEGKIESTCRAWLAIDDKNVTGEQLNYGPAWRACGDQEALSKLDDHAIVTPNSLLIPNTEIRTGMSTNNTSWERDYRSALGGFDGPAAQIAETNEKRRLDYERPSYEFRPGGLPGGGKPFAIPAGTIFKSAGSDASGDRPDRNYNGVVMAELQIWTGKSINTEKEEMRRLFIDNRGNPVPPRQAEKKLNKPVVKGGQVEETPMLGKPTVKFHFASNWINARNGGGSSQGRETGPGAGTDPKKAKAEEKNKFRAVGQIDRYNPDPPGPGGPTGNIRK